MKRSDTAEVAVMVDPSHASWCNLNVNSSVKAPSSPSPHPSSVVHLGELAYCSFGRRGSREVILTTAGAWHALDKGINSTTNLELSN
jgi:hypothetical protein